MTSFDTLPHAFLTIFVAITLEGWVDVMYMIQDAHGYLIPTIFFVLLTLFGSLFVLNLALAVVADKYDEIMNLQLEEDEEEWDEEEWDEEVEEVESDGTPLGVMQCIATSRYFNNFVFVVIVANTVSSGSLFDVAVMAGVEFCVAVGDFGHGAHIHLHQERSATGVRNGCGDTRLSELGERPPSPSSLSASSGRQIMCSLPSLQWRS